jgi:hypothetical protein
LSPLFDELGLENVGRAFAYDDHVHVITGGDVTGDNPPTSEYLVVRVGSHYENATHDFLSEHV